MLCFWSFSQVLPDTRDQEASWPVQHSYCVALISVTTSLKYLKFHCLEHAVECFALLFLACKHMIICFGRARIFSVQQFKRRGCFVVFFY